MSQLDKLVILITGDPVPAVQSQHGSYGKIIETALAVDPSITVEHLDARQPLPPRLPGASSALIITGSSSNVHRRDDWIVATEAWLRLLVAAQTPVLGLCFGHQVLAQALGGEVDVNPQGREMSTVAVDQLVADPIFDGVAPRFMANACHSDTVKTLPPSTAVLARSDLDPHQCLRFSANCYGVQFHPEFDGPIMRAYVDARRPALVAEGQDAGALHRNAQDTPGAQQVLRNFLTHIATR